MSETTKLRLAAFAIVTSVLGVTFGFVGVNSALDKKEGCISPSSVTVAYGICR